MKFSRRITRDTVLFVVGLLGIGYETIISNADRPTLLILFGGMVGLPAFLRGDEKLAKEAPPVAPPVEPGPIEEPIKPQKDGAHE